jgi:hypothetical protein
MVDREESAEVLTEDTEVGGGQKEHAPRLAEVGLYKPVRKFRIGFDFDQVRGDFSHVGSEISAVQTFESRRRGRVQIIKKLRHGGAIDNGKYQRIAIGEQYGFSAG